MVARVTSRLGLQKGEVVRLVPNPAQMVLFDPGTGIRLSA